MIIISRMWMLTHVRDVVQINQGVFLFGAGPVSTMAALCGVEFPIPNDDTSLLLENPYGISDKCEAFRESDINGDLSPDFLGMSKKELKKLPPEELPDFGALYTPRQPGPFYVNYRIIDVPRLDPSILVNDFSTEAEFKALVVYPVDLSPIEEGRDGPRRMEDQEMSSQGPFPVMAFSPGFGISPTKHIRTFYQLASHGMIVISQYSTHQEVVDVTADVLRAWADDIVTGLWHVTDGRETDEFLRGKVDAEKLVIAGHSMGGGLSMLATVKAIEDFDLGVKATIPIAPACKMRASECDLATEAAENLRGVDVLFIGGDEDDVERVEYSEYFRSLIPDESSTDLVVLEGATHCLWEAAPSTWKQSLQCGTGSKSPFEAIVEMQEAMVAFLAEKGFFPTPGRNPEDERFDEENDDRDRELDGEDERTEDEDFGFFS